MKKRIAILLIALILALIAAYFIYKPDFGRNHEGILIPEQKKEQENTVSDEAAEEAQKIKETAQEENETTSETEVKTEAEKNTAEKAAPAKKTAPKPLINLIPANKESQQEEKPVIKELKVEETHRIEIIDDDTDWSLLEKIPRSDIVIVDRIYRIKSPRKYFFK